MDSTGGGVIFEIKTVSHVEKRDRFWEALVKTGIRIVAGLIAPAHSLVIKLKILDSIRINQPTNNQRTSCIIVFDFIITFQMDRSHSHKNVYEASSDTDCDDTIAAAQVSPEQIRERARISWIQRDALASRPDVWIGGYSPEYHFHRRRRLDEASGKTTVKIEGYNDSPTLFQKRKDFPFH
jgi:hypothetical protein